MSTIQVIIHNTEVSSVDTFFDSAIPFVTVKLDNDSVVLFFKSTTEVEALRDELDALLGIMYAQERSDKLKKMLGQ